jgi:hypothetical protein
VRRRRLPNENDLRIRSDISGSTIPVFVIDQPASTRRASARYVRLRGVMAAFVRHARRSPSSISRQ